MTFTSDFKLPPKANDGDLWFIFSEGRLLTMAVDGRHRIPTTQDLQAPERFISSVIPLGKKGDLFCYGGHWARADPVPREMALTDLRALFGVLEEPLVWVAGLANQIISWGTDHQYCGRCGQKTSDKTDERAKWCHACGLVVRGQHGVQGCITEQG